jgi:hypothetical protein
LRGREIEMVPRREKGSTRTEREKAQRERGWREREAKEGKEGRTPPPFSFLPSLSPLPSLVAFFGVALSSGTYALSTLVSY